MTEPLKRLDELIQKLDNVRENIREQEDLLKEYKDKERNLVEVDIPSLMQATGQEVLRTTSGFNVELTEQVFARIPKEKQEEAFQWLRDHQEGGMIKEEVRETVHPQTLKAWVRDKLKEGVDLPEDLFSVFVRHVAKVK